MRIHRWEGCPWPGGGGDRSGASWEGWAAGWERGWGCLVLACLRARFAHRLAAAKAFCRLRHGRSLLVGNSGANALELDWFLFISRLVG